MLMKESKPKFLVIGGSVVICGRLNCEGILFYPVNTLSEFGDLFEEAIVSFEKDVESFGGLKGGFTTKKLVFKKNDFFGLFFSPSKRKFSVCSCSSFSLFSVVVLFYLFLVLPLVVQTHLFVSPFALFLFFFLPLESLRKLKWRTKERGRTKEKGTMADVDESESKPKILVIGGSKSVCGRLNQKKGLGFFFLDVISDFRDCEGILFYPLNTLSGVGSLFEEAIVSFEKDVESLGGIEGVVVYIWADKPDRTMKEEIVERLRLEERGCVWKFGAGFDSEITPKIDKFFKENLQTIVKPAKRD